MCQQKEETLKRKEKVKYSIIVLSKLEVRLVSLKRIMSLCLLLIGGKKLI